MAVVAVTANNTRISGMETMSDSGSVSSIGGGAGAGQEPDFVYQGSFSIARKVGTTRNGFYLASTVAHDITVGSGTYQTVMFKCLATNSSALLARAAPALGLRVGEGGNYHEFYALGNDNYPIKGGWVIYPLDINAYTQDATSGAPDFTIADYWGILADFNTSSFAPNLALDAIDIGSGLTIVGGDGVSADGTLADFVLYDEGTAANRFGYISTVNGINYVFGTLIIGSATATVFTDTAETIVYPDGLYAAGFSGLKIDLANALNDISITSYNFLGRGTITTLDTRPIITVVGTTGVAALLDACVIDNHASVTLTSKATLQDCSISLTETITQASGTIDGCVITGAPVATGVANVISNNPTLISNNSFESGGVGHAIEITTPGTYTFTGNTFAGYGADTSNNAAVYNNSGGLVTLNLAGGVSAPTIRNGVSATTAVNNSVTVTVNVEDETGAAVQDAIVYVQKSTEDVYTAAAGNNQGGTAFTITETPSATHDTSGWLRVWLGSSEQWYRYASKSGSVFTLNTKVGPFACSGGGTSTSLQDTVRDFTALDIMPGDTIRNETDGSWAKIIEVVDANNVTTTALQGGSLNVWTATNNWSVHSLALSYTASTTNVRIPIMNEPTTAGGVGSATFNYQAGDEPISIRVRKSTTGTRYYPVSTSGSIANTGFTVTIVVLQDTIAGQ